MNLTKNVSMEHLDMCNRNMLAAHVAVSAASLHPSLPPLLPPGPPPGPPPPSLVPQTPPPGPPPPSLFLVPQTITYGKYQGVIVSPPAAVRWCPRVPLVLLVPPAGGFNFKTNKKHRKREAGQLLLPFNCPKPCWYAYMNVVGNWKTRVPHEFLQFISDLHAMCSPNKNAIIAWGFSRGARWLEEIVREHSRFLDAAFIIAGYPETRGQDQDTSVAKELIGIKTTIVCMVHFAADAVCNASIYPAWYAEFEVAIAARVGNDTAFTSFMVPGTHVCAGKSLWLDWDFTKVNPEWTDWFEKICMARLDRPRFHVSA